MVNFNGTLLEKNTKFLGHDNRALRYGDALEEAVRIIDGKIIFWEDHYLRLMASMRILRMNIPMKFTMEFLEQEMLRTLVATKLENTAAIATLSVFRNDGGNYRPPTNTISYFIIIESLNSSYYEFDEGDYELELFKDYYVNTGLTTNLQTNNSIIKVVASVYAAENEYADCLLLNHQKNVVEAINGNIFMVKNNSIITPPLSDGCLNGIVRKKLIGEIEKHQDYDIQLASISPFDLQKADELFITNTAAGIRSVSRYRKKEFESKITRVLLKKLNIAAKFKQ